MVDNVQFQTANLATPANGVTIAAELIGGVYYQNVKVTYGAHGVATDVAAGSGLPVVQDGTWSVAQSGTWNITNITGTITLPTGAATAAKQPALGTAGTASSDVITVQGITAMTPLKVDGSGVTQPVSGTVTVQQATASNLKVDLSGTAANATAIKVDGSAVTQPVSYATTGHGTATGALRVELPTDGTGVVGLNSGTNAIGKTWISYQTIKALTNASVSASSSGDNTIVAGTAAQTVRVFKLVLVAASAVSVTIKDGAGSSLTGAIPLVANGSLVIDAPDGEPEFITSSGNGFIVNLSSAVTVTGWVQYTKS